MFDPSITTQSAADAQRKMVGAAVRARIGNGTFTYTELLSAQEPMRTMGLECLDGIVMASGNVPGTGGEIENWDDERIRLVAIDPEKPIKVGVLQDVKVPGTFRVERKKVMKIFGDVVDMTDRGPHERLARQVLVQRGWPVLQNRGNSREGDVVEWRWLEREALGTDPAPGVVELYEQLLPRVEAFDQAQAKAVEAAAQAKAEKKAKTTKSAGTQSPAGV